MPFSFPFLRGQRQSKPPQKTVAHSSRLRRSDPPPPVLQNAPTSGVFFPNDDYPPGFPCTSGCGKKFPTVIQLEIHIQHYCDGPYDEIEAWQGASDEPAPQPLSASSDRNHDRIVRWLDSSDMCYLEPNPPFSPSPPAIAGDDDEDFAVGRSYLDPKLLLKPTVDAVTVNQNEIFALGTRHVESSLPPTPTVDAVAVDHNEGFASGTGNLEPNPLSTPTVDAVAVNRKEGFKCPLCGKYLSGRRELNVHREAHALGRFPCPVNRCSYAKGKSQAELDFHLREDHADVTKQRGGERFACWYCGRNMKTRRRLIVHVRLHEDGRFPCSIDNCSFPVLLTQGALDQHLKKTHTDDEISGSLL